MSRSTMSYKKEKQFARTFTVVSAILGAIAVWKSAMTLAVIAACCALFFFLGSLFAPVIFVHPNRAWLTFGELLHKVVSPIILLLIYTLVFIPIGFLMRLFTKNPMDLQYEKQLDSYWKKPDSTDSSMKQQY